MITITKVVQEWVPNKDITVSLSSSIKRLVSVEVTDEPFDTLKEYIASLQNGQHYNHSEEFGWYCYNNNTPNSSYTLYSDKEKFRLHWEEISSDPL